ncbi:hypothetical protein CH35J_003566 [Colletotrichum higginsianum]|uniref:Uncharacterized protein n=1 Tax=Colletotrichum higginsianum TaxID=80884 RepID=A0A4T0WBF9_9PEZI|nr:hypothetical protein CH35J_003566 [Colletotrichum higginsianum]
MAERLGNLHTRGNEINYDFADLEARDDQDSGHPSDEIYTRNLDNFEDSPDLETRDLKEASKIDSIFQSRGLETNEEPHNLLTRDLELNDESLGDGFGNVILARDKKTGGSKTGGSKTGNTRTSNTRTSNTRTSDTRTGGSGSRSTTSGVDKEKKEIKEIQDKQRAQKKKANAAEDRERDEIREARERQKKGTTATEKDKARKKKLEEQNELNDVKKTNSKERERLQKEKDKEKAELAEEKKKAQRWRYGECVDNKDFANGVRAKKAKIARMMLCLVGSHHTTAMVTTTAPISGWNPVLCVVLADDTQLERDAGRRGVSGPVGEIGGEGPQVGGEPLQVHSNNVGIRLMAWLVKGLVYPHMQCDLPDQMPPALDVPMEAPETRTRNRGPESEGLPEQWFEEGPPFLRDDGQAGQDFLFVR